MNNKIIIGGAKIKPLFDGNITELQNGYDNDLSYIQAIQFGKDAEERLRPENFTPEEFILHDDENLQIRARVDGYYTDDDFVKIWECKTSNSHNDPEEIIKSNINYKYQIVHYYMTIRHLYKDKEIKTYYTVYNKNSKSSKTTEFDEETLKNWSLDLFGTDDTEAYKKLLLSKINKLLFDKPEMQITIYENNKSIILRQTKLQNLLKLQEQINNTIADIKHQAMKYLETNELKTVQLGKYKFTMIPETEVITLDKKQIENDYLHKGYEVPTKKTKKSASIRINEIKE